MNGYGAVIVTHNSEAVIGPCLDALERAGARQIVVVDNASDDKTVRIVRNRAGVTVVANPWNRGFAAAANQGIALVASARVLLVNPDAEVQSGLEEMESACTPDDVAAVGGRLVGPDGAAQAGFTIRRLPTPWALAFEALGLNRIWPGNPVNRHYRCRDVRLDRPAQVEQPAGAFLMIRRDAWRRLGGFDEIFRPLWFEDVDFCKRAIEKGYRILYVPSAVARHRGGHSVEQLSSASRAGFWYGTLLSYAARHFRPAAVRAVAVAVVLGSLSRAVFGLFRGSLGRATAAANVIGLAGRFLAYGRSEGAHFSSALSER